MEVIGQLHASVALHQEKNAGTHLIGNWVGPRAGVDVLKNKQFSCPCRDSNHVSSNPLPSHYWLIKKGISYLPNIYVLREVSLHEISHFFCVFISYRSRSDV
jgi:hypothetical protein